MTEMGIDIIGGDVMPILSAYLSLIVEAFANLFLSLNASLQCHEWNMCQCSNLNI